jgi:hypothetical protein
MNKFKIINNVLFYYDHVIGDKNNIFTKEYYLLYHQEFKNFYTGRNNVDDESFIKEFNKVFDTSLLMHHLSKTIINPYYRKIKIA